MLCIDLYLVIICAVHLLISMSSFRSKLILWLSDYKGCCIVFFILFSSHRTKLVRHFSQFLLVILYLCICFMLIETRIYWVTAFAWRASSDLDIATIKMYTIPKKNVVHIVVRYTFKILMTNFQVRLQAVPDKSGLAVFRIV